MSRTLLTRVPLLALLVTLAWTPTAAGQEAGLSAPRLYCGAGRPVPINVDAPDGRTVELVLLDAANETLAGPTAIQTRSVDLAEVMPEALDVVASRATAAYLQLMIDNEPAGAALVIQPLLSRLVPDERRRLDPRTNQMRTFVDGWADEWADEAPPPPADGDATEAGSEDGEPAAPARANSGARVYLDQDVRLETSLGDMLIELRPDAAPNTAWNFRHLTNGGFYDGVLFHRVVPRDRDGEPFVIQGGDPLGTGYGGPGYWLPLEASTLPHDLGVVSMARADDPDSAGSQFFICLSRTGTARLDGQYCPFARVVGGLDTVKAIAELELRDVARGRPVDPPIVHSATLVPAPPREPGTPRPVEAAEETEKPKAETERVPR